jgi:hypothetical protein
MSATKTAEDTLSEARRMFAYDAEFHAKVVAVTQHVALDCQQTSGQRLTRNETGAATVAAAVALVLFGATCANGEGQS